jgi:hypothetical protein
VVRALACPRVLGSVLISVSGIGCPRSRSRVLGSNGAENRFKGYESPKLGPECLSLTHLGLSGTCTVLTKSKVVYTIGSR